MAFLHVRDAHSGLGLGWILLIALGGGIVFFMVVGLVLAWYLQSNNKIKTARVYSYTVGPLSRGHSTMKLSKRRLLATDYSTSRFSSRLSMSMPRLSLLPPLPSYQSFFRGRPEPAMDSLERSDSVMMARWTGVTGKEQKRSSWIGSLRDSWLGRGPTLPEVDVEPSFGTAPETFGHPYMQNWAMGQKLPPSDSSELQGSRTEPTLYWDRQGWERDDVEEYRGRQRAKTSERSSRPFVENPDLRTILQSTEQRLRSGTSQSPVKTPRSSPHKSSSPRKTPRSHMTTSSGGSMRAHRGTPSPSKRTPGKETPGGMSQHGSTTSIGSAANSLIAEATQQLELPGGSSSPSRALQGQEWQPQPQAQYQQYHEDERRQQQQQQQSELVSHHNQSQQNQARSSPQRPRQQDPHHYRRKSVDSDVSSSLSTVYSANEPEEVKPSIDETDPFVEAGGVKRSLTAKSTHHFSGPRPLRRRSQTVGDAGRSVQQEQSRIPLSAQQVSKDWSHSETRKQDGIVPPVSFDPPVTTDERRQSLTAASSESSMVTISVHTTDDEDEIADLPTPKASQKSQFNRRPETEGESTPTKVRTSLDISSSPLNEQDILRLLLSSSNRRALPHPPLGMGDDNSTVPTPLCPRPKSNHGSPLAKTSASRRSSSSSDYDRESLEDTVVDEQLTGSPSRASSVASKKSTARSVKDMPGVTSTVAELRRMNSLVSSYSCASMASTAVGESETAPNLASLKSGSLNVVQPRPKQASMGSKHYLSLGKSSPPKKTGLRKDQQSLTNSRSTSRTGHRRTQSIDEGKENQQGLGLKMPRIEVSSPASSVHSSPTRNTGGGLREGRKGGNLGREPSLSSMSSLRGRAKLLPVQEGAEESRLAVDANAEAQQETRPESLGLYDSDGFLIGSPDREKRLSRSLR